VNATGSWFASPDDQRFAKAIAQEPQHLHGLGVDLGRSDAATGEFGGLKIRPAPHCIGDVADIRALPCKLWPT